MGMNMNTGVDKPRKSIFTGTVAAMQHGDESHHLASTRKTRKIRRLRGKLKINRKKIRKKIREVLFRTWASIWRGKEVRKVAKEAKKDCQDRSLAVRSDAGTRTRVYPRRTHGTHGETRDYASWVKAKYADHLHHIGTADPKGRPQTPRMGSN